MSPRELRADAPPRPHWVFFADRGSESAKESARFDAERALLHPRRLERLKRAFPEGPFLFENDLAVSPVRVSALVALGARVRHESRWLNAVSVVAEPEVLEAVAALPFVREVRPVARWRADSPEPEEAPPAPKAPADARSLFYGNSLTQLALIRADALQDSGYTGDGVLVAMFDSGFRKDHDAFRTTRMIAERDFVQHDGNTQNEVGDTPSQHNHGTGTWAVAGGYDPGQLIGFAFGAQYALAKTEDVRSETHVEEDNWVAAAEWADSLGADVISASLGYRDRFTGGDADYTYDDMDGRTTIVALGAREAIRRGICVVTAMGNEGPFSATLISPADVDSAVSVGAVDSGRQIAFFSSRGPSAYGLIKPEVCAHGVATLWANAAHPSYYGTASGTSLATPCMGGGVALLLEAHPEWSPGQVLAALRATSPLASAPDNTYGRGIADLVKASRWGGSRAPARRPWPFALISPTGGQTIEGCAPVFRWQPSRHGSGAAVTYRIEIDEDPGFGSPFVASGITGTAYVPTPDFDLSGKVHWRVIAVGPQGREREAYLPDSVVVGTPSIAVRLLSPVGGASLSATPDFLWGAWMLGDEADSIRSTVVFGLDRGLTSPVRVDVGSDTSFTAGAILPNEGRTHYWRIEAEAYGADAVCASAIDSFVSASYPPSAFDLVSPASGDTIRELPARFVWRSSSDPNPLDIISYEILLIPSSGDTFTVASADTSADVAGLRGTGDYTWSVEAVDRFGNRTPATESRPFRYEPDIAPVLALAPPRPNPFGPNALVPVTIPGEAGAAVTIRLRIYSSGGTLVRTLVDGPVGAGEQSFPWDGLDDAGRSVPSGVYYVRLEAPSGGAEEKIVRVATK
jgi:subtilisin family serine protease